MPTVKKSRLVVNEYLINEREALDALIILFLEDTVSFWLERIDLNDKIDLFQRTYHHSHVSTLDKIREIYPSIDKEKKAFSPEQLYQKYKSQLDTEPMKLLVDGKYQWIFQGYIYEVKGHYSDEQIRLLILEDFDRERRYFEKLKAKFDETQPAESVYERPRIPENVRIEVWRRDGGKCARCGSRERLEYDHIIPISKGGSNTARNIELLCEKHNRSKSNNVV